MATLTEPLNICEAVQRCRGTLLQDSEHPTGDQRAETHQQATVWKRSACSLGFFSPAIQHTHIHTSSHLGSNQQGFTSDTSGEACVFWAPRCDTDCGRPARAAQSFCRIKPQPENVGVLNLKHSGQNLYSRCYYLLLREFGQRAAKRNHGQEGSDDDGFHCQRGNKKVNVSERAQRAKRRLCRPTVFSVGVEGRQLRLCLRDDLLPVHALLQPLKHALLPDSLNVPSGRSQATDNRES